MKKQNVQFSKNGAGDKIYGMSNVFHGNIYDVNLLCAYYMRNGEIIQVAYLMFFLIETRSCIGTNIYLSAACIQIKLAMHVLIN